MLCIRNTCNQSINGSLTSFKHKLPTRPQIDLSRSFFRLTSPSPPSKPTSQQSHFDRRQSFRSYRNLTLLSATKASRNHAVRDLPTLADKEGEHSLFRGQPFSTSSSQNQQPQNQSEDQSQLTIWQRTRRWSQPYMALSRIDKPIGTWLLFWPCAWSITLASHALQAPPSIMFGNLVLFGVGALVMRGAGCTINDMWDVKVDKMVERTKARPLAAGDLTYFQALSFLGVQLSVGLGVLVNLNWYSILLGASSLSVVTIYPLMKRITYWPQLVLGLAFNWGALLGWSAIAGSCQWMTVLPLYFGSVCWTLVYDTIYAHQDKTDDISAGVKSTALLFSTSTVPILSIFSTLFISNLLYSVSTISSLLPSLSASTLAATSSASSSSVTNLLGPILTTGHPFFLLSTCLASLHLYRQLSRTDLNERSSCWRTFVSNRDLGAIVWFGLLGDYLIQVGLKGVLDGMVVVG